MPLTIDSNQSSLSYALESSLEVLPGTPVWYPLEPNSYNSFGGDTKTTMRQPITATRQRSKGTVTDVDVKAGFTTDVTQDNLTRLLQGFFFAYAHEKPKTLPVSGLAPVQIPVTGVTSAGFTAASGLGWPVGSIVLSKGFSNAGNDSLWRATAAAAGLLTVSPYVGGSAGSALVVEAAPPAAATLESVGFALSGDVLLYGPGSTFAGATVIQPFLSSAATIDFTTLGLLIGEWIYLGDVDDLLTDTGVTEYNFIGTGTVRNRGFCRIAAIAAHQLTFDLAIGSATWTLGTGSGGSCPIGTGEHVSMYFGTVIRNEPLPANIVRTTYSLQRYLGVGANNNPNLEYISGAIPSEIAFTIPSNNKLSADLSFVGMSTAQEYQSALPGTYVPLVAGAAPFNTSQDVFALLLYIVNPLVAQQAPLFGYATEEKLTLNNNIKPNKAIGVVGAFEGNTGMLDVSGTVSCYFDDIAAQQAVSNNANVGLTNIFSGRGAGFILDMPELTLALPGLKVEQDKPIMADVSHNASVGTTGGYTMLYNKFNFLPAPAVAGYAG